MDANTIMRVGIIGAGSIAAKMAETLSGMTTCRGYAIASRDAQKAEAFAQRWGFTKSYGSYEAMLADDAVDLVYIATPHSHHLAHASLAINYGKPCLVEKSFTANAHEAKQLLELAHAKGIFVTEAIWTRYQPVRQMIQSTIDSGIIGDIKLVNASLCYSIEHKERILKPELCGGAMLDLGVYSINFLRMFFPQEWQQVTWSCAKAATGVDITDVMSVNLDGGIHANLQASANCVGDKRGIICGVKGRIEIDNINNPQTITVYDRDDNVIASDHCPEQITGYEYQVEECRRCLLEGLRESPMMPHAETLKVMQLMDEFRKVCGVVYPMD